MNRDDEVCSCGQHYGLGVWSPEERAKVYKKLYRLKFSLSDYQYKYLASYADRHGKVQDRDGRPKEIIETEIRLLNEYKRY